MIAPWRHRLWAELAGDSLLESLRLATVGWVPRKPERVRGIQDRFAVSVLCAGSAGTFRDESGEMRVVKGPGVFFVHPGCERDYGVENGGGPWEEIYWIVEGDRVEEWMRLGWWPTADRFWPVSRNYAGEARRVFRESCEALERRDTRALDRVKLALERWLSEGVWTEAARLPAVPESPVARVVEEWRRDPVRDWSPPRCARDAGMSYSRFRSRFVKENGRSPYAYLLQLRMELARRWLRSTDEPIKAVAARCGFSRVEPFIRAFAKKHGHTPSRWRAAQAALVVEGDPARGRRSPGRER